LQAFDGDGYRSHVDAVVWATLFAVIAELPKLSSQARDRRLSRSSWNFGDGGPVVMVTQ
jgi:hypothetical protein